jgi:hypothetical protein
MYNNIDNNLNNIINNMSINEKNELLQQLENNKQISIEGMNIIEPLVNVILDITTVIAKGLKIIK